MTQYNSAASAANSPALMRSKLLANYAGEIPGCLANLQRILSHGRLGGTGKLLVLPVDQGFEHGPDRSFAINSPAYDPEYHINLAIEAGLSAYAAPLGMIEAVAARYAGQIPLILKVNSNNALSDPSDGPSQALVGDCLTAVRLGCVGIGLTIYPGAAHFNRHLEQASAIIREAKAYGLAVVVWSYPRGGGIPGGKNTALDVTCYAAHIAALLGAHIIKVKVPDATVATAECQAIYGDLSQYATVAVRIQRVMQAAFAGRRLVLFSGGGMRDVAAICEEAQQIRSGGGSGSIIGRNTFQRPYQEALAMLAQLSTIYLQDL